MIDESATETGAQADVSVPQLETRFSIARDAISNKRSHAGEALRQFLQAFGAELAAYRIEGADEAPLDVHILGKLAAMKASRDYFLELMCMASEGPGIQPAHEHLRVFLGQSIGLKQAPRDVHFNHLWCDHYRFFVRELFLCTIALLLRQGKFDLVVTYLQATYCFASDAGQHDCNFLKFDAYVRSLDEFRARRLRQPHPSIAAALMRERCDLEILSFDDVMQADFVLCLYGLLHHPDALTRWCPRTLIYAADYERNGFDLFSRAASLQQFSAVATVLDVRDQDELMQRFERSRRDCRLDEWKLGDRCIPFVRYMGAEEFATV